MGGDARSRRRVANGWIAAVVLVIYSGIISGCRAWDCAASDKETLLAFKQSFYDRSYTSSTFSTWDSSTNCCTWEGVKCRESDGAVLELTVVQVTIEPYSDEDSESRILGGNKGAGLVALTQLKKLKIQGLPFDGAIPSEWGGFSSNLVVIIINNANLRDDIPSSLASIPNLYYLDLSNNHLTGSIPRAFCQSNIKYIDVSSNDMGYFVVPQCLGNGNVTVNAGNQGQSTSPGTPAPSAGSTLTVTYFVIFAVGTLSTTLFL